MDRYYINFPDRAHELNDRQNDIFDKNKQALTFVLLGSRLALLWLSDCFQSAWGKKLKSTMQKALRLLKESALPFMSKSHCKNTSKKVSRMKASCMRKKEHFTGLKLLSQLDIVVRQKLLDTSYLF